MRFEPFDRIHDAYAARHEPEAQQLLARVFWTFLILFFASVVGLSVAFGVWEFVRVPDYTGETLGLRPQATFNRMDLQSILEGFDARASRFEERLIEPVAAQDPS